MWERNDCLECEYIRTMQKNELLLHDRSVTCGSGYYNKMLTYNRIPGILSFVEETIDSKVRYRYNIGTKQSLAERYTTDKINHEQLDALIRGLTDIISHGREYLIDENDYVLSPKYIFYGGDSDKIYLCCYPFLQKNIRTQLTGLFEYFLSHIDYQDLPAVKTAYELYMKSKGQGFGFADLLDVLNRQEGKEDKSEPERQEALQDKRIESVQEPIKVEPEEGYCLQAEKNDWSIRIKEFPCYIGRKGEMVSAEGCLPGDMVQTKISIRGDCIYIEDMKSNGGTFVNGRRLAGNEIHKLSVGDSVMLADRCYRFVRIG